MRAGGTANAGDRGGVGRMMLQGRELCFMPPPGSDTRAPACSSVTWSSTLVPETKKLSSGIAVAGSWGTHTIHCPSGFCLEWPRAGWTKTTSPASSDVPTVVPPQINTKSVFGMRTTGTWRRPIGGSRLRHLTLRGIPYGLPHGAHPFGRFVCWSRFRTRTSENVRTVSSTNTNARTGNRHSAGTWCVYGGDCATEQNKSRAYYHLVPIRDF